MRMHLNQAGRTVAIFWLIILSCSTPMVAIFTVPLLVLTVRKFLRIRKLQKAALEVFKGEVAMARYAARMKRWGT